MQDTTIDEIYACDIQWDTNRDLTTDRYLTDIDEVRNKFKDTKENVDSNSHIRSKVSFKDFNTEKFQAHYIMVIDYGQYRNDSSKYYGNGIGWHQVLLGAGDTVNYFVIDAVVMTLVQRYGWDNKK